MGIIASYQGKILRWNGPGGVKKPVELYKYIPKTGNMLAYYRLDETTGTIAYDSFINHYDGDIVYITAFDASGMHNGCYERVGTANRGGITLRDADIFSFDTDDAFSFSWWFNFPDGYHGWFFYKMLYDGVEGISIGYNIQLSVNHIITLSMQYKTRTPKVAAYFYRSVNVGTLPHDTWHHAVVTYDGSKTVDGIKVYLNGTEKTTTYGSENNIGSLSISNTGKFQIFGTHGHGLSFQGKMDEVGIWNTVLSATDVSTLWNGGAGRFI